MIGLEVRRQTILAVTSELPWPLDSGGHLRTFHLLRGLAGRFAVRLVTSVIAGQEESIAALEQVGIEVKPVLISPRAAWREFFRAVGAAIRAEPYVLYHRHNRRQLRARLKAEMKKQKPDLLYLDHLDSAVFWPVRPPIPLLIDLHNVYSTLVRLESNEQRFLVRKYLHREAKLLERMERRAAWLADSAFAVSPEDARYFLGFGNPNVYVVPNGVDCKAYDFLPARPLEGNPLIVYVGAMSWAPNVNAARFLAKEILPSVRSRFPNAGLRIVGRDPLPEVQALGCLPGVEVTGAVPSVMPHLAAAHILAVPLDAGGGTRLKILEAFAAGLPVVSTPVGCEGLAVKHGKHLFVSERRDFAASILEVLDNNVLREQLAGHARALAVNHYDWTRVGAVACDVVTNTLQSWR